MLLRQIRLGYWESRKIDTCANPYLSVAAHIVVGMPRLASDEELDGQGMWIHPRKKATHKELARCNITEKPPGSMTKVIRVCKDDEMFRESLEVYSWTD